VARPPAAVSPDAGNGAGRSVWTPHTAWNPDATPAQVVVGEACFMETAVDQPGYGKQS